MLFIRNWYSPFYLQNKFILEKPEVSKTLHNFKSFMWDDSVWHLIPLSEIWTPPHLTSFNNSFRKALYTSIWCSVNSILAATDALLQMRENDDEPTDIELMTPLSNEASWCRIVNNIRRSHFLSIGNMPHDFLFP